MPKGVAWWHPFWCKLTYRWYLYSERDGVGGVDVVVVVVGGGGGGGGGVCVCGGGGGGVRVGGGGGQSDIFHWCTIPLGLHNVPC